MLSYVVEVEMTRYYKVKGGVLCICHTKYGVVKGLGKTRLEQSHIYIPDRASSLDAINTGYRRQVFYKRVDH